MTETLEQISDEEVFTAMCGHLEHLNYELGELHNRVQASLRRMDEKDKLYGVGKYRAN
ncbi:MAG: hypothetical protein U1B79_00360 [Candidatus Pacearchaeota archaeon]|nr:hypothetical protein [Nanoarchaeota archaeon]MDZ4226548.1 hypothetical protein [Candidatus Pacearchaeota archaeon]